MFAGNGFYSIKVSLPTPLNRYWRPVTRYKLGKTKEATEQNAIIVDEIVSQCGGKSPDALVGKVELQYAITLGTRNRNRDIDSMEKGLLDCIQASGMLTDDSQIRYVEKHFTEPDKVGYITFDIYEV